MFSLGRSFSLAAWATERQNQPTILPCQWEWRGREGECKGSPTMHLDLEDRTQTNRTLICSWLQVVKRRTSWVKPRFGFRTAMASMLRSTGVAPEPSLGSKSGSLSAPG